MYTLGELLEFYKENRSEIITKYKNYSKNTVTIIQKKGCAFCALEEILLKKNIKCTQCQINKLSELILMEDLK